MSYAGVKPQTFLALRTLVKNNAHFTSESEVLYPAGAVLVLHDYEKKTQRYIQLNEKSVSLEMIVVSPSRSMAAIIINDEKGHIVIYDLKTLQKKRTLNLPHDANSKRFEHMCFSYDEKLLLTISGEPDWMMLSYNWEKGKVETFTRANYINNPGPVSQVLSSPTDSAICCILGPGLFRLMMMQETVWRQYGFQKAEQVNVTSAAFINSDRILVGTSDGRLLLVDNGDLKSIHDAVTVQIIVVNEKEEKTTSQPVQIPKLTKKETDFDRQVRAITPLGKGFAYSCEEGQVHMFERTDKNTYKKRNLFTINDPDFREEKTIALNIVQHMSMNSTKEKLLATTNRSQIYVVKLWGPAQTSIPVIPFKHLGESLHNGPITGLAMCVWKPVFMTCGAADRTVRLWNFETAQLEMVKQYEEDILSVSLHPTALFAAIGFTNKLKYMIVLLDDIQPCRTFGVSRCHLTSFSYNGHYLAAVNRNFIIIYSTISFHVVATLKGHSGKVTSFAWTPDDRTLVSCGEDGAVYEWDIASGDRKSEVVEKEVKYWECAITADGKFIYAVGDDGKLKEMRDSNVLRVFGFGQKDLPHVVLSRSDLIMMVCGASGNLISLKVPLIEPIDQKTFLYHNSKILQMRLTYDDKTLITVSETGSLFIWNVTDAEGRTIEIDKNFSYCTDVLIPKTDLEDKVVKIQELSQRMRELVNEQDYKLRETESKHSRATEELHRSYSQTIKELKQEIERKDRYHSRTEKNLTTEIEALREIQQKAIEEIEAKYSQMLIFEYQKLDDAEKERKAMSAEYEKKILEIIRAKDESTEKVKEEFLHKISILESEVDKLRAENEQEKREHAEIKEQIENDADREIIELKAEYERTLRQERESYNKIKGDEGVMRKKFSLTAKENEKYKTEIARLQNELSESKGKIASLNQDIGELKREIYERDLTIQEKEKYVYDMKKMTEELEKYKFVLSHKIEELKNQIHPKDIELEEKEKQIREMQRDMESMQAAKNSMEKKIVERGEKLKNLEREMKKIREKCERLTNNLKRVSVDIYSVSQNLQDHKKLNQGVRSLFEKYSQLPEVEEDYNLKKVFEEELTRQNEQLRMTIESLKASLTKIRNQPSNSAQLMKDNMLLLEEIKSLREQLTQRK